jgi:hypothetical protein
MYGYRGFGVVAGPPLGPGMMDCGSGLSVQIGTVCPAIVPDTPAQIASRAQGQADYDARAARCKVYESKEHMVEIGAGVAAALLLPGSWKLAAIPVALALYAYYPRSVDCDYGF